jgi:hypothetical protein
LGYLTSIYPEYYELTTGEEPDDELITQYLQFLLTLDIPKLKRELVSKEDAILRLDAQARDLEEQARSFLRPTEAGVESKQGENATTYLEQLQQKVSSEKPKALQLTQLQEAFNAEQDPIRKTFYGIQLEQLSKLEEERFSKASDVFLEELEANEAQKDAQEQSKFTAKDKTKTLAYKLKGRIPIQKLFKSLIVNPNRIIPEYLSDVSSVIGTYTNDNGTLQEGVFDLAKLQSLKGELREVIIDAFIKLNLLIIYKDIRKDLSQDNKRLIKEAGNNFNALVGKGAGDVFRAVNNIIGTYEIIQRFISKFK